jgi:hypothetical protein
VPLKVSEPDRVGSRREGASFAESIDFVNIDDERTCRPTTAVLEFAKCGSMTPVECCCCRSEGSFHATGEHWPIHEGFPRHHNNGSRITPVCNGSMRFDSSSRLIDRDGNDVAL